MACDRKKRAGSKKQNFIQSKFLIECLEEIRAVNVLVILLCR